MTRKTLIIPPSATNLRERPATIKNQSLFSDVVQLAKLYHIAFPTENIKLRINEIASITNAALSFFAMIEEECFPLEQVWEWQDSLNDYAQDIKPWLYNIPLNVIGLDWGLEPSNMSEPQALLMRLASVGNYSKQTEKHKQILHFDYPKWKWDGLLNRFKLSQVAKELESMILPPPFDMLPALIKYITHESDTYFLDYTIESWPHYIQWNKKNFDWLKKDWQTALQIKNQADELTHWLIENPNELEKIWTILKIAHHKSLDSQS